MNKIIIALLAIFTIALPACAVNEDFIVEEFLKGKNIQKPLENINGSLNVSNAVPIYMTISTPVKSEQDLYEGQIIKFVVSQDAKYNGKMIAKQGTVVKSRVETVIDNGMNGIPASVVLGDFMIPGISPNKLTFYYEKYGHDLSLLVYPLKWVLTPLWPTGSLTNFIKGGHAKIGANTKVTIYYYP